MSVLTPAAARAVLTAAGHRPGEVLGAGMEGVVVDLGAGRVAKVWHTAPSAVARRLQAFRAALHDALAVGGPPPVRVARIHEVLTAAGHTVTVEDALSGRPLRTTTGDAPVTVADADVEDLGTVLAALAAVPSDPLLAALPVLPGGPAFGVDRPFASSLARLVTHRADGSAGPLAAAVPDLAAVVTATVAALEAVRAPAALVHGDLIPANVLRAPGRPPAAVDFGFLSTVGDPCFDAAVTASVYDMYGPRHRDNERALDDAFTARFGHDPQRLGVYRAAYALVTATVFSASGRDGHFAWCVAMLARPDVRAAVDL